MATKPNLLGLKLKLAHSDGPTLQQTLLNNLKHVGKIVMDVGMHPHVRLCSAEAKFANR